MVSKDALDQEIEAKRLELEKLRARTGELQVELRALERAAALRPPRAGHVGSRARPAATQRRLSGRGGRVPGAISTPWRQILVRVARAYPDGATPEDIAAFGPVVGLANLRPRDARQRCEKYLQHGFVEQIGERYRVTDTAVQRFSDSEPPALRDDASDDDRPAFRYRAVQYTKG